MDEVVVESARQSASSLGNLCTNACKSISDPWLVWVFLLVIRCDLVQLPHDRCWASVQCWRISCSAHHCGGTQLTETGIFGLRVFIDVLRQEKLAVFLYILRVIFQRSNSGMSIH